MKTFQRIALMAAAAAVMAGCSSGVKLNDASVEDRNANANATSGVTGVDLTGKDIAPDGGPANVGRVVYFDFDSYVVKADAQRLIDGNARFLKADANRKVVVEGHTDERGGREYNLALGQKRAEAVVKSLTLIGVKAEQLEAVSFGEEKPAVTGSGEEVWAKNRRVELRTK